MCLCLVVLVWRIVELYKLDVMWLLCVHVCVWSGGTLSKCIDQTLCLLHRLLGVYYAYYALAAECWWCTMHRLMLGVYHA